MLPETLFHIITPHLEGYSDKNKEELIKMIRGEDHRMKPKPITERDIQREEIREVVQNYFKRAQKRNAEKRKKDEEGNR